MRVVTSYLLAICLVIAGCSSPGIKAPAHEEVMSKILKPESNMALIYTFRYSNPTAPKSKHSIPIHIGGEVIGNIWQGQYIYYYAYPHMLILEHYEEGVKQYEILPGKTYYFYFTEIWGKVYWNKMDQELGQKYLKKYNMSGDFRKIIFKYGADNAPLIATENNKQKAIENTEKRMGSNYSLDYKDKNKTGLIKYRASMNDRDKVFTAIEKICNTKNIALKAGGGLDIGGAVYQTLDEAYKDYTFNIQFICLY